MLKTHVGMKNVKERARERWNVNEKWILALYNHITLNKNTHTHTIQSNDSYYVFFIFLPICFAKLSVEMISVEKQIHPLNTNVEMKGLNYMSFALLIFLFSYSFICICYVSITLVGTKFPFIDSYDTQVPRVLLATGTILSLLSCFFLWSKENSIIISPSTTSYI